MKTISTPIAVSIFLSALLGAQETDQQLISVPGTATRVKVTPFSPKPKASVSRDSGQTWTALNDVERKLAIRYGEFDPMLQQPEIPTNLVAKRSSKLFIVQFESQILDEFRAGLRALGAEIHHYLPHQSYVVRVDPRTRGSIADLPYVRWVGQLHPAYRLQPEIIRDLVSGNDLAPALYNIVFVNRLTDEPALTSAIEDLQGKVVTDARGGNILLEARLSGAQLLQIAQEDTVLWIDRSSAPEVDMDNARIQGGANYIETAAGIDGKGMSGHIMEGVYATHPEFAARSPYRQAPFALANSTGAGHGTNTAGQVYARGVQPQAKGMLPFAQMSYTNYSYVMNNNNRFSLTTTLVDPNQRYKAMFQTASWGYGRTTQYTSRSAEMDRIMYAHDKLLITQSQSNAGATSNPRMSRPQAWAKNIIGVGGFRHYNNSNANDDCWCRSGSTGPAADGRISVTFGAYYDSIYTTSGSSGYTSGFGGTSGATPIVNGLAGLTIQMFTEGLFGYPKATWQNRFSHLPYFSTTKAIMVANSRQVTWNSSGSSAGANRYQVGFGMPSVEDTYRNRDRMLVIDQEDSLSNGAGRSYYVYVAPNTSEFRAVMAHPETEAAANASIHRINSVDLRVKGPYGTTYWGNNGLLSGHYSSSGGVANDRDTTEAVIIKSPPSGAYGVTVRASAVRQDADKRTPGTNVTFGLAVRGIDGGRKSTGMQLALKSTGAGNLTSQISGLPSSWTVGYTLFSLNTGRHLGLGNVFGLEADSLTLSLLASTPTQGSVFAFTNNSSSYPYSTYTFPPAIAMALRGRTMDAVAFVAGNRAKITGVSNVSRVSLR